jgi:hypothetical protein
MLTGGCTRGPSVGHAGSTLWLRLLLVLLPRGHAGRGLLRGLYRKGSCHGRDNWGGLGER